MQTRSYRNHLLIVLGCAALAACGSPTKPVTSTIPPTSTPPPYFDNVLESSQLTDHTAEPVTGEPTAIHSTPILSGPTRTPDPRVLDYDPADLILLPEEIPGPYSFFLVSSVHTPNSEVLRRRGQEAGTHYITATGRIDGVRAEFMLDETDNSSILFLNINTILFKSSAGPSYLAAEKGGPCRPEDYPRFVLLDNDLELGDFSFLCTANEMEYWVRVGYRNIYFDVGAVGFSPALNRDLLIQVATAQLMKLESLTLSDSLELPPTPTPTFTWTPTPQGSPEVFPSPTAGPTWITEADNGQAFLYFPTYRFGLDLDPAYYFLRDLDYSECSFIGQISNWSLNGPDSLPVGFEAIEEGECKITVRDFSVHIVVVDWP